MKNTAMIKIFYDVETTGLNPKLHCIHQLSGMVEINDQVVKYFNYKLKPHDKAAIDLAALRVSRTNYDDLMNYPDWQDQKRAFCNLLGDYVDRFNKVDKIKLIGFNNRSFDDVFLRTLFELAGDTYFGSRFWSDTIDVMVLASEYLEDRRASMPSFKLTRVATELGLLVDKEKSHDAQYDVELTRDIYRIVTSREIEI